MLKNIFMMFLAMQLFACTSGKIQQHIVENDWQAIGEDHGINGMPELSLTKLQKLSEKYGNGEVDYPAYQKSYKEAVIIYCQPKNAFLLGGSPKHYHGVCDQFPHGYQFRRDWDLAHQLKSSRM